MKFTLSLTSELHQHLAKATTSVTGLEGAAFLLCGHSIAGTEVRLLSREVVEIQPEEYLTREPLRMSIGSTAYVRAAKRASQLGASVVFVHSHPDGIPGFSPQDNREEPILMRFLNSRDLAGVQGSLLLAGRSIAGRAWVENSWRPLNRIRIVGPQFLFVDSTEGEEKVEPFYDRQVRAFGPDVQRLLGRLHIGIVGAGGTGSAVGEQLTRLGVGALSIFDGDHFEKSNINRVYGSKVTDDGHPKAAVLAKHLRRIGLGTGIRAVSRYITVESAARRLRDCDIVFGCTDNHTSRAILNELSAHYLIPLIDLAVKVESVNGTIREIFGRVTTVLPGEACLYCRKRVDPNMIRLESMPAKDRRALADEQYAPELETDAPAVISFTSAVASQAVSELIHRLTGFMGSERLSTEVLLFLASGDVHTNRERPNKACICAKTNRCGRGDTSRSFLGLSWAKQ